MANRDEIQSEWDSYLKPTGSTCYNDTGITCPVVIEVDWQAILPFPFWWERRWSNQQYVICFSSEHRREAKRIVEENHDIFWPRILVGWKHWVGEKL